MLTQPITGKRRWAPAAAGCVVVAALLALRLWLSGLIPGAWMADFSVYYAGGRAVLEGTPLYDLNFGTAEIPFPFTYSPFAALVFVPLTSLGPAGASVAWTVVNFASLAAAVWLTLGLLRVRRRGLLTAGWTVAVLVLDPVVLNLAVGQINIIVAALVLLDFSRVLPERWRGIALGIAAGVKLIPLIFIVYLACTGRGKTALRAGLSFAGTIAFGFLLLPSDSVRYWVHGVVFQSGRTLHSIAVNQSLPGFFARLAGTDVAPGWTWPVTVLAGVLGLALGVRAHRRGQELVGLLVVAFTSLVVSPIVWAMHAIWIVPGLLWLCHARWQRGRVLLPRVVFAVTVVLYLVPLYELVQGVDRYQNTVPGNLIATFGGVLAKTLLMLASVPFWLPRLRAESSPEPVPEPPGTG
ncbi:MAG TPA: glycosyltransferase 87 family protein [Amycolatopsis sp.]